MGKELKKGFTLIELLAVITIISIILVIGIPMVSNINTKSNQNLFDTNVKNAISATKLHYQTNYGGGLIGSKVYIFENKKTKIDGNYVNVIDGDLDLTGFVEIDNDGNVDAIMSYDKFCYTTDKGSFLIDDDNPCFINYRDNLVVTLDLNGGETTQDLSEIKYSTNDEVILEVPTRDHYKFDGWKITSGNATIDGNKLTLQNTNVKLMAMWKGKNGIKTAAQTLIATCTGDCLTGTPNADGLFKDENGDYRYTGANPSNYATFNGETWRIIGIFNGRIKLMRDAAIGNTKWDSTSPYSNAWEGSEIEQGLNGNYLTTTGYLGSSLSSDAQNLIDNAEWYTTAITHKQNTASAYNAEHTGSTISRKVGLIYPSDYGYASSACYNDSTKKLYDSTQANSYHSDTCKNSNWMYTNMSSAWWTIMPYSGSSSRALYVSSYGYVGSYLVNNSYGVRPVVYLKSDVSISGDGKTTYYTFS